MNIFEKLNEARILFRQEGFKKGGENAFSHYSYFQLKDILEITTKICKNLKIFCAVSFGLRKATMTIIDCEKTDDKVIFTSPMSRASLKGCHDVQNLGAVETYLRRYLYMTAFEIDECDPSEDLDNGSKPIGKSTSETNEAVGNNAPTASGVTMQKASGDGDWSIADYMTVYEAQLTKMMSKDGKTPMIVTLSSINASQDDNAKQTCLNWLKSYFGQKQ